MLKRELHTGGLPLFYGDHASGMLKRGLLTGGPLFFTGTRLRHAEAWTRTEGLPLLLWRAARLDPGCESGEILGMKIHRIDHVSVNVNDLPAAKAFFMALGLEVKGEGEFEGKWLDRIVGLEGVKTVLVMMGMPKGEANLELVKYYAPADEGGVQRTLANTPGIRHIAFAVEDIEAIVAKLKKRGVEMFSEIQQYEKSYKLCYVRGPEGIILELAEEIG